MPLHWYNFTVKDSAGTITIGVQAASVQEARRGAERMFCRPRRRLPKNVRVVRVEKPEPLSVEELKRFGNMLQQMMERQVPAKQVRDTLERAENFAEVMRTYLRLRGENI